MQYVARLAEFGLRRALGRSPAALLYGPRQAGKTTLMRRACRTWRIFDLEREADFSLIRADVEGFLRENPRKVALDEAQRLPELFPALRCELDRVRSVGRYLLLGSASPELLRTSSESLAGRIAHVGLTPLLVAELQARKKYDRWFFGGYPALLQIRTAGQRMEWIGDLVRTILERDLRNFSPGLDSRRARDIWGMLAHVHGGLLNASSLAASLSVTAPTVNHYLDLLEGAFLIRRLRPYFVNIGKRLTKSSKLYIRDTGMLHYLAGLRKPADLRTWPGRGASWEGLVVEELCSLAEIYLPGHESYFWRTHAGAEVDLLIKVGAKILPIEIKLGAAVSAHDLRGLKQCMADLGLRRGIVVHGGTESRRAGGIELMPFHQIVKTPRLWVKGLHG